MKALQKAVTILADIGEDDCTPTVYESIWECINLIEEADFNEENQRLRAALEEILNLQNTQLELEKVYKVAKKALEQSYD